MDKCLWSLISNNNIQPCYNPSHVWNSFCKPSFNVNYLFNNFEQLTAFLLCARSSLKSTCYLPSYFSSVVNEKLQMFVWICFLVDQFSVWNFHLHLTWRSCSFLSTCWFFLFVLFILSLYFCIILFFLSAQNILNFPVILVYMYKQWV